MKKISKKTLGRPKGEVVRDKYLTGVRFSAEELAKIRDDAKAANLRTSAYVRGKLGLPETNYRGALE